MLHKPDTMQMVNQAQFSNFLLLGDFNVDFLKPQTFLYSHVNDLLCNFSLTDVVPSFTHVSSNGRQLLIDLDMVSEVTHLQSCTTIPPGVSLTIKWKSRSKAVCTNLWHIWMYKKADFSKAQDLIQQTDWDRPLSDNKGPLNNIMDQPIP